MRLRNFALLALLVGASPVMAEEKTSEKCLPDEFNECVQSPDINIEKEDF